MENQQQQPQTTALCRAGCGFYGTAGNEGFCSKCFKDTIKRKQEAPTSTQSRPSHPSGDACTSSSTSTSAVVAAALQAASNDINSPQEAAAAEVQTMPTNPLDSVNAGDQAMDTSGSAVGGAQPSVVPSATTTTESMAILNPHINSHCDSSASLSSACSANSLEEQLIGNNNGPANNPTTGVKKANRCHVCKKRVGLTGFVCRCGGLYCGEHRYDQAHSCQFDYKTMEREEIRKNNPVVVSDKIQRI